jgi:hypothetical protein
MWFLVYFEIKTYIITQYTLLESQIVLRAVPGVEHAPPCPTHEGVGNCCIHSAKIELFGYGPNYRIELSQSLKPNA